MRDHRPKPTTDLLDDSSLGNIQQRAIALSKLDKAVKQHLNCADHCRVSNYRQGVLVIETASAAWSMRLNYERLNLLRTLRENILPNLVTIEVKVNPALAAIAPEYKPKSPAIRRKPLTAKAAGYLLQTADSAPEKIKRRLERIAALAADKRNDETS
ncbi:hypothetical protein ABT56_09265 [Photobacterium aquae]|uniref:DUF721 domain-containing protein n=1 Tax=Photobacterium aquae TaxID=1195763 RepID=A0A0J1H399_9GAMM|nr:DciA family protein [Photobacterium aquae]KLV06224.1 hypothetical protein ABT56_09265 [Photobacterium aquae]